MFRKIERAVTRGARFLDRYEEGWISKMDLTSLVLDSTTCCVLGQVYKDSGHFDRGIRVLEGIYPNARAESFGFDLFGEIYNSDYAEAPYLSHLQECWNAQVIKRLTVAAKRQAKAVGKRTTGRA